MFIYLFIYSFIHLFIHLYIFVYMYYIFIYYLSICIYFDLDLDLDLYNEPLVCDCRFSPIDLRTDSGRMPDDGPLDWEVNVHADFGETFGACLRLAE